MYLTGSRENWELQQHPHPLDYLATVETLQKHPGDTLRFTIELADKPMDIQVTVGVGVGVELLSFPESQLAEVIQPNVQRRRDPKTGQTRPVHGGQCARRSDQTGIDQYVGSRSMKPMREGT